MKTINIFSVRSSPDQAKIGFSPDPVRSSPVPRSSLVKCLIREFVFRIKTEVDQIFEQVYRIRIGQDFSMKILDCIRIAKLSDLFNFNAHLCWISDSLPPVSQVKCRGDTGSQMSKWTPAGFCIFLSDSHPEAASKIYEKPEWILWQSTSKRSELLHI